MTGRAYQGLCAILLVVVTNARPLGAQGTDPAPAAPPAAGLTMRPSVRFEHLSTEEGLPQSHVTAIVQDRVGFMWFGTQEGLARYDGTGFTVYQHRMDGPSPLPSSYVTALAVDDKGILWIGTDSGLAAYDVNTDEFSTPTGTAPAAAGKEKDEAAAEEAVKSVTALHAAGGHLWVGYAGGRIERVDIATRSVSRFGADAGIAQSIRSFALAKDGSLWVGTEGDGLVRLAPDGKVTASHGAGGKAGSLGAETITALLLTQKGTLWVGTEEAGVARMEQEGTFRHLASGSESGQLTDSRITSLFEDRRGNLWVGTQNGLNRIAGEGGQIERFEVDVRHQAGLSFPWITSIFQDRTGVLWIGTFAGGLDKFDELATHFAFLYTGRGPASFLEDPKGFLWIGTYPGGLIKINRRTGAAQVYVKVKTASDDEIDLAPHWVTKLHQDPKGTIWMGVMGLGLVGFDPDSERVRVYGDKADELGAAGVWDIEAGAKGVLWLATWGNGLVKFDPRSGAFTNFVETDGVPTRLLYSLHTDRRDPAILWLGTAKEGLVRFDTSREAAQVFRHVPTRPDSLSNNDVLSIEQTSDGALWIGTYGGGLNRFDGTGRFERFAQNVGMTNGTIYGVLADERGTLWLSTNGGGLIAFDSAARTAVALDAGDGVLSEYAQAAAYRTPDGRFYFGGPSGALTFQPQEIKLDTEPPPVIITNFQIYNDEPRLGRPIWFLPDIELDHDETLLTFRFAALSYASPNKIRYQYRLLGLSDRWIDLRAPVVTVSVPTSGDFRLEVRAASRHGTWSKAGPALAMTVAPPPWRTWWAYTLYGLAAALAIFGFVRLQTRRVERARQASRLVAVERDLELTAAVQSGFLPADQKIHSGALDLFGFYQAADRCSGDWWWYELTSYGSHVLLVGDVTGHGPGPAMVTAAVASAFRAQQRVSEGLSLEDRLAALNDEVLTVGRGTYQMSLTAIEIDPRSGELSAYGAGGLPAIVLADGSKPTAVVSRGTPLGTVGFQAGRAVHRLAPGARLFVCTDGVVEVERKDGRPYGMRRLIKVLESTRGDDLESVASVIFNEATATKGQMPQKDDWTFTVADWRGND
jgi:ligand-binding sensor domain-containing protein/serine phosphatase RsbU (regulator of sigma subunit)